MAESGAGLPGDSASVKSGTQRPLGGRRAGIVALAVLCVLVPAAAWAQTAESGETAESGAETARSAETAPGSDSAGEEHAEDRPRRSRWATGEDAARLGPIGLTDTHALDAGQVAFSYRYEYVHFDDLRVDTRRRSTGNVLADPQYTETPRSRDLQVHLLGLSWAPHRRVTLSLKLPFIQQETNVVDQTTGRFETSSKGIGDLEIRALVPFMRKQNESLQIEFGLTAPTGSFRERDTAVDGEGRRLSFPQQFGSGTVDLLTGGVYRGRWKSLSWGVAARAKWRLYENSADYRLGGEYEVSPWISQSWTDWLSTSLRFAWNRRDNIHPRDDCNPDPGGTGTDTIICNPERDPKRQAFDVLEIGPGVNFRLPWLGQPRFGVEVQWPFYQDMKGPQLERDWQVTTGWKWSF